MSENGLTPAEMAAVRETTQGDTKNKARIKPYHKTPAKGKRAADERRRGPAHQSREAESHQEKEVHTVVDEPWVNPSTLPDIPARSGMRQRWVRVGLRGQPDATNMARRFREGWRPRAVETLGDLPAPIIQGGKFNGHIGIEGLVLCEMPEARARQRDEYFRKRRDNLNASINEELQRVSEHGSPAFGRIEKAETTKRVRPAPVAVNE